MPTTDTTVLIDYCGAPTAVTARPFTIGRDADLVLDTTGTPVRECLLTLWRLLQERGYLADDAG